MNIQVNEIMPNEFIKLVINVDNVEITTGPISKEAAMQCARELSMAANIITAFCKE